MRQIQGIVSQYASHDHGLDLLLGIMEVSVHVDLIHLILSEHVIPRPEYPGDQDHDRKQYEDPFYKTVNGESQMDVRKRFEEAFFEIIKKHKDKRIAIFSHGYAITFFLLRYCKLMPFNDKKLKYEYNGKILFDKVINAPEVFKLTIEDDLVKNIELIEFDDLPFEMGV